MGSKVAIRVEDAYRSVCLYINCYEIVSDPAEVNRLLEAERELHALYLPPDEAEATAQDRISREKAYLARETPLIEHLARRLDFASKPTQFEAADAYAAARRLKSVLGVYPQRKKLAFRL